MEKIIVAVDFSEAAENAAVYAAQLALEIHAEIILFHAYQYPALIGDVPYPAEAYRYVEEDAEANMKNLAETLSAKTGGRRVAHTELREGDFVHQLSDFCASQKPGFVVLGTNGITAAGKFFFGSQALQAIRRIPFPVLTVPPGIRHQDISRLGLITDLSRADTGLPVAAAKIITSSMHAKLFAAHITSGNDSVDRQDIDAQRLQKLFGGVPVELHYVREEDFEDGVIKFVELYNIDLLVVIPSKHTFFNRLFHTTHTERLLKHPFIPMLFLKEIE